MPYGTAWVFQAGEQDFNRQATGFVQWLANGGKADVIGDIQVIKTQHGQVFGHPETQLTGFIDHTDGL
jgi:hypothetical protein